jgi:predicted nucleotidyltransferase
MDRFQELQRKVLPVLRPYVTRIAVFGSYSRGDSVHRSDIDLLVQLKPPDERPSLGLKWFGLERELSEALGQPVELISEKTLSPYLRDHVEQELVTLYEEG